MPLSTYAELVRLPALLSVPGDALLGAAASGSQRGQLLVGSSAALYAGGMALNDYADRAVDALERPGRPIPSGRVSAARARMLSVGLLAGGVLQAWLLGGRRALRVAVPLAAAVVGYDTQAKSGPRGPAVMAACRGLDVLLGAAPGALLPAVPVAGVVAAHTANVTVLSQHEVDGAAPGVARRAQLAAVVCAVAPVLLSRGRSVPAKAMAVAGGAAYAAQVLPPLHEARTPAQVQRAVGAGVLGLLPLQAGLLGASGAPRRGAAVLALLPLARHVSARRRVT